MDITSYCEKEYRKIYQFTASLIDDYIVINGDKAFYEFVGNNDDVDILNVIHPDDREEFMHSVDTLAEGTKHLIIRMMQMGHVYRYCKMRLEYNGRVIGGFKSYDINVTDINAVEYRFVETDVNMRKYRKYLAIMNEYYFEYEISSGMFKIFTYVNDKANMHVCEPFTEFCEKMYDKYLPNDKAKNQFTTFKSYIEDGVDNFRVQFQSTLFSRAAREDMLIFDGKTMYVDNKKTLVMGVMKNMLKWQSESAYYLTEAARDGATGLLNKRAINEYITELVKSENIEKLSLIIVDVDNFKSYNDQHGHLFGDEIVNKVADCIRSVVENRGVVGRFGGDEFVIALEEYKSIQDVENMVALLKKNLSWSYMGSDVDVNITVSVGISQFPQDGKSYPELFGKADKALYIAKDSGKDRYVIYDDDKHSGVMLAKGDGSELDRIDSDWNSIFAISVVELYKYGKSAIPGVLKRICDATEISGIVIYSGEDLKRSYEVGAYKYRFESAYAYLDKNYLEMFNKSSMLLVNDTSTMACKYDSLATFSERNDLRAVAQCITYKDGEPDVLVSFDILNHGYKWTTEEATMINTISLLLGQIIQRDGLPPEDMPVKEIKQESVVSEPATEELKSSNDFYSVSI